MKYRVQICLALVLFCFVFSAAELGMFRLARIPIAESLKLAGTGPLSLHTYTLLDRLNEWRADTPELSGMIRRMITWSLCWACFKQLGFSWGALAITRPDRAALLGFQALGGMLAQHAFLAVPRLLLYAGLLVCAQGLLGPSPFAIWALMALLSLLAMLQVSSDLAMARVMSSDAKYRCAPKLAGQAIGAWLSEPGTMIRAWLLRIAQVAVAAGPIYQQAQAQPGPSSPLLAAYFVAASFVLWGLRLWMIAVSPAATQRKPQLSAEA